MLLLARSSVGYLIVLGVSACAPAGSRGEHADVRRDTVDVALDTMRTIATADFSDRASDEVAALRTAAVSGCQAAELEANVGIYPCYSLYYEAMRERAGEEYARGVADLVRYRTDESDAMNYNPPAAVLLERAAQRAEEAWQEWVEHECLRVQLAAMGSSAGHAQVGCAARLAEDRVLMASDPGYFAPRFVFGKP
jgi:hypothetical protein